MFNFFPLEFFLSTLFHTLFFFLCVLRAKSTWIENKTKKILRVVLCACTSNSPNSLTVFATVPSSSSFVVVHALVARFQLFEENCLLNGEKIKHTTIFVWQLFHSFGNHHVCISKTFEHQRKKIKTKNKTKRQNKATETERHMEKGQVRIRSKEIILCWLEPSTWKVQSPNKCRIFPRKRN